MAMQTLIYDFRRESADPDNQIVDDGEDNLLLKKPIKKKLKKKKIIRRKKNNNLEELNKDLSGIITARRRGGASGAPGHLRSLN